MTGAVPFLPIPIFAAVAIGKEAAIYRRMMTSVLIGVMAGFDFMILFKHGGCLHEEIFIA